MQASRVLNTFSHRRRSTRILVLTLIGILALLMPHPLMALYGPSDLPDDPHRRYFPETGFWVSGDFLTFFDVHGGLKIFGYPITSPYNDHGILVQYFQNARMEWHELNEDAYKLQLGLLGEDLNLRRPPVKPSLSPSQLYFPETGHSVNYMFRRYFVANGGVEIFGYPISEMLVENQRIVQYFQRLKLIWDPVNLEMTVGNLGELYVNAHPDMMPPDVTVPASYRVGSTSVPAELDVVVGIGHAVVSAKKGQSVTAVVVDVRRDAPVPNAPVRLTLRDDRGNVYPDLARDLVTDERGRVAVDLPLKAVRPGSWVILSVNASLGQNVVEEREVFLVWW